MTGAQKAEAYALQGNAYYRLEKFQPAVDAIKKALSLSDKPSDSWYQILMASYAELEQYDEAAKVVETAARQESERRQADRRSWRRSTSRASRTRRRSTCSPAPSRRAC